MATLLALGTPAADPSGGEIAGNVRLASPSARGEAPRRTQGFLRRIRNPLKPPRPFNPLPEIIVVVTGGVPAAADAKPGGKPVKYKLLGEGFEVPLLPVLKDTNIEIRNFGRGSPELFSPDDPELIEPGPVSPNEKRLIKKLNPAHKALEIRARDSAHLSGRVVAFDSPYFSRVDSNGKFSIKGVPAGRWTIRLWYRSGWVTMPAAEVDVVARRATSKTIPLPANLQTDAPPKEPSAPPSKPSSKPPSKPSAPAESSANPSNPKSEAKGN